MSGSEELNSSQVRTIITERSPERDEASANRIPRKRQKRSRTSQRLISSSSEESDTSKRLGESYEIRDEVDRFLDRIRRGPQENTELEKSIETNIDPEEKVGSGPRVGNEKERPNWEVTDDTDYTASLNTHEESGEIQFIGEEGLLYQGIELIDNNFNQQPAGGVISLRGGSQITFASLGGWVVKNLE